MTMTTPTWLTRALADAEQEAAREHADARAVRVDAYQRIHAAWAAVDQAAHAAETLTCQLAHELVQKDDEYSRAAREDRWLRQTQLAAEAAASVAAAVAQLRQSGEFSDPGAETGPATALDWPHPRSVAETYVRP